MEERRITKRQHEQWLAAMRQGQSSHWCKAVIVDPNKPASLKDRIEMRLESVPILYRLWTAAVPM